MRINKYFFDLEDELPKYVQIAQHIEKLINEKQIRDGERLLPIRELSKILGVNNVTVVSAYKFLQQKGYAVQKMGSGTYAKGKEEKVNFLKQYSNSYKKFKKEDLNQYIDFSGETTSSEFFPVETFKKVLNKVLDRDGAEAFVYQSAFGYDGLRKSINNYFWNNKIDSDNIIIVSGAQQGIDIVSKALINVNDNIAVEKPTYSGALNVFKGRRANIFEIDMFSDGIDVAAFKKVLKKNKISCFYVMSYFQNPTGGTYSIDKKREILNLAEEYDFYILEDDYLSELIYDDKMEYKSFKSLDVNDRVIYVKSFSKIFLPGIRLGYLISPYKFNDKIQSSKVNTDITTSSLMQRALDLYIRDGYWIKHMSHLNEAYKERYEFMESYIELILKHKVELDMPRGGLHFYLKISDKIDMDCLELFHKCKREKVLITPGVIFYKNSIEGKKHFRLGFSKTNIDEIKSGIDIIGMILN